MRHPRRFITPFLLVSLGVGVIAWYGIELYRLPHYSEPDIQTSVEANLAMDLARMGPHLKLDDAGVQRLRLQIQQEVNAEIRKEREEPWRGLAVGLACVVIGLGGFALLRTAAPQ